MKELLAMHEAVEFNEEKHTYSVRGQSLDSVTKIISSTLSKGDGFLGWVAKMGTDWRRVSKEEAAKGKQVHRLAENWARKRLGLEPLPSELSGEAAYLFAGLEPWLDRSGIEPVCQPELRLHHTRLGYAGTLDLAATYHGSRLIVDFKTCPKADTYYDDWAIQLGAYGEALNFNWCGHWLGGIVRVPKSGEDPNFLLLGDVRNDFHAFEGLLSVYRWKEGRQAAPKGRVIQAVEKFMQKQEA